MQRRIADIKKDIAAHSARSAWDKGVKGYAEVYDGDICERLCTESEKKKTHDGELPLMGEDWLTVQARALRQAARIVIRYANRRD